MAPFVFWPVCEDSVADLGMQEVASRFPNARLPGISWHSTAVFGSVGREEVVDSAHSRLSTDEAGRLGFRASIIMSFGKQRVEARSLIGKLPVPQKCLFVHESTAK